MVTRQSMCAFSTVDQKTHTLVSCLEDVISSGGTNHPTRAAAEKRALEVREIKAFLSRFGAWGRAERAAISLSKVKGAAVFTLYQKGEPTPAEGWPMLVMPWKAGFDRGLEQLGMAPRFAGPKPAATPAVANGRRGFPVQAAQGTYFLP